MKYQLTQEDKEIMYRAYRRTDNYEALCEMLIGDTHDFRLMRWHTERAIFEKPSIRVLWREIQNLKTVRMMRLAKGVSVS